MSRPCRCDERSSVKRPPGWEDFRYCPLHGVQGEPDRLIREREANRQPTTLWSWEAVPPLRRTGNPAITIPPGAMRRIELEESVA